MEFAKRMEGLSSAIFSQLDSKKKELLKSGREVINFSIGTPDLPPAKHITEALREASAFPENYKYAINDLPELIEAVINWYDVRYGVQLNSDEIVSMSGSQEGLSQISLTMADPGDLVMVPDPGYPIFSIGPSLAGAILYRMPLIAEKDYLIDFDNISPIDAHKAKLMIVSYPNNPVTATAPMEFYEKLIWFAKKYDIAIVHDNAYSELVFDGKKGGSFLELPGAKEVGIEFNSLSKSYNMTGCRISFAMGNKKIIKQFKDLKSHLDYGIFLPVQKAAIAALSGPQDCVHETMLTYQNRRDLILKSFKEIGWSIPKSPATMFVWAAIPKNYLSSIEFTFDILKRTGVIVVPGSSFGENGEGYVRLALVQPENKIIKAAEALKQIF